MEKNALRNSREKGVFLIPDEIGKEIEIQVNGTVCMPVAVLYSADQDAFHIESLSETLAINAEQMAKALTNAHRTFNSYHLVALAANDEKAKEFCDAVRKEAKIRNKYPFED